MNKLRLVYMVLNYNITLKDNGGAGGKRAQGVNGGSNGIWVMMV